MTGFEDYRDFTLITALMISGLGFVFRAVKLGRLGRGLVWSYAVVSVITLFDGTVSGLSDAFPVSLSRTL